MDEEEAWGWGDLKDRIGIFLMWISDFSISDSDHHLPPKGDITAIVVAAHSIKRLCASPYQNLSCQVTCM